jgi:hypothetical protein
MKRVSCAVILSAVFAWFAIIVVAALTPTPTFEEVRARTLGSEAVLLARDGEPLQRLRVDMTRRQRMDGARCDSAIAGARSRCRRGPALLVAYRV